jgi:hypothetical protein
VSTCVVLTSSHHNSELFRPTHLMLSNLICLLLSKNRVMPCTRKPLLLAPEGAVLIERPATFIYSVLSSGECACHVGRCVSCRVPPVCLPP